MKSLSELSEVAYTDALYYTYTDIFVIFILAYTDAKMV